MKAAFTSTTIDGPKFLAGLNALLNERGTGMHVFSLDPTRDGLTIGLRAVDRSIMPALEIVFDADSLEDEERVKAVVLRLAERYRRHGKMANRILAHIEGELAVCLRQIGCGEIGIRITAAAVVYSVTIGAITDFGVEVEHVGYDLRPTVERFSVSDLSHVREIADIMALEQPALAGLRDEAVSVGAVGRISRVALSFLTRTAPASLTDILSRMAVVDHLSLSVSGAADESYPFFVQWWSGRVVLNFSRQRFRCIGNQVVIFDTTMPPSVAIAARGMRLGDIFHLPLLDPETLIASVAAGPRSSIEVKLADDFPFFDRSGRIWADETGHL